MENAASEKQVKKMASREERARYQREDDIKAVCSSVNGRRFLWHLMEKCSVFKSVHHPSGSQVYYNAGQQDIGHFVMSEILEADPKLFLQMQQEAKDYGHV
jgi:hypothetical protein